MAVKLSGQVFEGHGAGVGRRGLRGPALLRVPPSATMFNQQLQQQQLQQQQLLQLQQLLQQSPPQAPLPMAVSR